MVNFHNLIIKIFKSHGFEIESTSNYSKYILAAKDNINLSIGYSEPNEDVTVAKLRDFFRTAKKDNAHRLIYILPAKYPATIDRFAEDRNIQLWDGERLEREVGRAVVADLKDPDTTYDLTLDSTEDTEQPATESEGTGETIPIMVPFVPLGDDDGSNDRVDESDNSITGGDTTYGETSLSTMDVKDIRIIKPIVSKDDASTMANKIVKGFRFNLELIPYYIFDYTCEFDIDEKEESITSGLLGINGLTSNVEDWSDELQTTKYLNEPHTKLDVKFPFEKAQSIVKEAVIERNTKLVETKEEFESTIIFENKKVEPKPGAIQINSKGICFLPVWCIEGSNGLMIIDATSGKIIKEDIFKDPGYQDQDSGIQEA